jgi:hypothetical protein
MALFATSWDIQWHTAVGRDRTLTAPHLFILGSITIMGIAALAAVLIETTWTRRNPSLAQYGITFANMFSGSLGTFLVGYGALTSAIAFPIDQYWHTLYGIDVSIWAPFHIMSLAGTCVSVLGITYILADGASLALQNGAKNAARAGYIGMIVAFATLMGLISIILVDSTQGTGYISLGSVTFTVYPLMFGTLGAFVLFAAIRAVPWRAVATSVAVVYALLGLLNFVLIPLLMNFNLQIEQQHLLLNAPTISVLAILWQYALIIAAVLLDGVVWIAARRRWSLRKAGWVTLVAASIGMSLAALFYQPFISTTQRFGAIQGIHISSVASVSIARKAVIASAGLNGYALVIIVVSLLLGLLGIYIGSWMGTIVGESMRKKAK